MLKIKDILSYNYIKLYKETEHFYDKNTPNTYHLENSVYNHTKMVLDVCQKTFNNDKDFKLIQIACILHDMGKCFVRSVDDEKKKVYFRNHEQAGFYHVIEILSKIDKKFDLDNNDKTKILKGVLFHDIYKYDLESLVKMFDYETLQFLAKVSFCDCNGRITESEKDTNLHKLIFDLKPYSFEIKISQPTLIIPIGIPNSGKSTYFNTLKDFCSVSRDYFIEKARKNGESYSECFKRLSEREHKIIDNEVVKDFNDLVRKQKNIFIDKTNTSKKGRKFYLNGAKGYHKKAVIFCVPFSEILKREQERAKTGKEISIEIYDRFMNSLNIPTYEDFDEIEYVW